MSIYNSKNPNVRRFIDHVESLCEKHKVTLDIRKSKFIWLDGAQVAGYFDALEPEIRVAGESNKSVGILVHEFAHMLQWLDKKSIWYTGISIDQDRFWEWLAGKRVNNIDKIVDAIIQNERDNEIRTVKLIKKFNLPIDVSQYTREANAYLLLYHHVKNTRIWTSAKPKPAHIRRELRNACPDKFLPNYSEYAKYFEQVRHIYEKHNF